jgi:hypothetical protein
LHRAENLLRLSVYAPRLQEMNLKACYSLEKVVIENAHPVLALLDAAVVPSKINVDTTNALLADEASNYLKRHPRVMLSDRSAHYQKKWGFTK